MAYRYLRAVATIAGNRSYFAGFVYTVLGGFWNRDHPQDTLK